MEPVTLLVTALAVGAKAALQDTATQAVKDSYAGLKTLLVRKFGRKSSLESLEEKPESKAKQAAAEEDLAEVKAAADDEIVARAQEVLTVVERDAPAAAKALGIDLVNVRAAFLKVGNIRSEGTGASVRDSQFDQGITIGDITAGQVDPPKRP